MGDVFLEGVDVLAEGFEAGGSEGAGGAGHLALKTLLDRDITGSRELFYLDAEVPCGGSCLLLNVREISRFHPSKKRHHSQPQLRMKYWIQFREHHSLILAFDNKSCSHEHEAGQCENEHLFLVCPRDKIYGHTADAGDKSGDLDCPVSQSDSTDGLG